MNDIIKNIRELLFKHDCVILPSFGGFIGNYQPAQIDKHTNNFNPPVKAISFNRNLTHNDGLLIGKISEERNIGYADSKRIVEEFIDGIRSRLAKGERVEFEMIGYFQSNSEGSIEFEPDRDVNFLLDSYGFSSFRREPVLSYGQSAYTSYRDKDAIRSGSSRKMAWRAIIAVPFIAAMIIVPLKTDLLRNKASLNPINGIELPEAELAEKPEEHVIINDRNIVAEDIVEPEVEITEPEQIYYIVAGSFKSRDNALKMIEDAKSKGYSAGLSENENGFYRVFLNSYSSKEEAVNLRNKVRADYSDCWILQK